MTSCPHSIRAVLSSTPRRVGSIPLGLSCCPGKELPGIRRSGSSPLHSWAPDQYGLRRRDHDGPEQPEGGREGPSLWVCSLSRRRSTGELQRTRGTTTPQSIMMDQRVDQSVHPVHPSGSKPTLIEAHTGCRGPEPLCRMPCGSPPGVCLWRDSGIVSCCLERHMIDAPLHR
jgi:hypothetical protein